MLKPTPTNFAKPQPPKPSKVKPTIIQNNPRRVIPSFQEVWDSMKADEGYTIDISFTDFTEEIQEFAEEFLEEKLVRLQRIKTNNNKKHNSYKALRRLLRYATAHGGKNTRKYEVLLQRY